MESKLVDSKISMLVREELRKTEKITNLYNSFILNIVLLLLFIIVIGGILYMRYNDKKNSDGSEENYQRNKLLEKVANMQHTHNNKNKEKHDLITNFPIFSNIL
jgi:heme/copper-type cytochrome/quinol oxidase subunit 2